MNPIINPLYLETFLEFRTKYSQEIYSRDTLRHLTELVEAQGGTVTTFFCRPEIPGDYYSSYPSFDAIDVEIVEKAYDECLATGLDLVLPKSLQWRYEFALFFLILFSKYNLELEDTLMDFQRIVWQLLGFPPTTLNFRNWNKLCAGSGWNMYMFYQAIDAVAIGSWIGIDGWSRGNWSWMTFVLDSEESIVNSINDNLALGWQERTNASTAFLNSFMDLEWLWVTDRETLHGDAGATLMAKLCEIIRLEVSMNPIKSLNYPTGA